jgi:hypothetical protein
MEPLPAAATDLSFAIAEKELFRSVTEIELVPVPPVAVGLAELLAAADVPFAAAGAELLLEPLELQPAATSTAAAVAAAASPARADTEYNGVPRFAQTCRTRHVREQIRMKSGLVRPGYQQKC